MTLALLGILVPVGGLVALWLVVNTVTAFPVEAVAGLALMALGLPFYFFFRASGWLARARVKERPY